MQVQPYLFFDGRCEEAVKFYQNALGAEVTMLMRYKDSPDPSPPDMVPPGSEDKVMHTSFRIGDTTVMASDGQCHGKPNFQGFSLLLTVANEAEADRMFGALIFSVLKMSNSDVPYWTDGWTTTMNIYTQLGLVTLVGLVAKNGILIVEFANKLQERGRDKLSAIKEAAMTRLRPVLMTSVATVAGHFPLTLADGPGAAARNSIGLVLVGGMTVGTIFTLFVVPSSLYMLIARQHNADRIAAPQADQADSLSILDSLKRL